MDRIGIVQKQYFVVEGGLAIAPTLDNECLVSYLTDAQDKGDYHTILIARAIPKGTSGRDVGYRQFNAVWEWVSTQVCELPIGMTPTRVNTWELAENQPRIRVYRLEETVVPPQGRLLVPDLYTKGAYGVINLAESQRLATMRHDGMVTFTPINPLNGALAPFPATAFACNLVPIGTVGIYDLLDGWVARPEEEEII